MKKYTEMSNNLCLLAGEEPGFKNQIEFLLGKKILLSAGEVNSLAHLTVGNEWVLKVLDKLGLTIDDIIYEEDRKILRDIQK